MIATCEPRQYPPQVVRLQVHAPKQYQAAAASCRNVFRNRATSSSRRDLHPRFCFLYGVQACVNKVRGRHRLVANRENSNPPRPHPPCPADFSTRPAPQGRCAGETFEAATEKFIQLHCADITKKKRLKPALNEENISHFKALRITSICSSRGGLSRLRFMS